jgi:lipoprotein-releasing system ATP-binding protein
MNEPVLALSGVVRRYRTEAGVLDVLTGADLTIAPGEIVGLIGPSGSGKSTLLHVAGLLEPPDAGSVTIAGVDAGGLGDRERTRLRRAAIGFVYQFHQLLPEFDARDNVAAALQIAGRSQAEARRVAAGLLENLGLGARLTHRPGQLSGGEQQRVAIARALANSPKLLLADEPTGNLDPRTSREVFDALRARTREAGAAALIATHNVDLARELDRVVTLSDGKLVAA